MYLKKVSGDLKLAIVAISVLNPMRKLAIKHLVYYSFIKNAQVYNS